MKCNTTMIFIDTPGWQTWAGKWSKPGKSYWRGRVSLVDIHVRQFSLDQLLFILKLLFTIFIKQATLMRRSTVLSLSLQLVFPIWIRLPWFRSFSWPTLPARGIKKDHIVWLDGARPFLNTFTRIYGECMTSHRTNCPSSVSWENILSLCIFSIPFPLK